jgi:hypothetical protein
MFLGIIASANAKIGLFHSPSHFFLLFELNGLLFQHTLDGVATI